MRWPRRMSIAGVLSLLILAGCAESITGSRSTGSTSSTPAATSSSTRPVCQGLATINTALTSLSNAGNNVTVGQLKSIQSSITVALNVVDKLVPADSSDMHNQLKAANDQLGQTLAGLPDGDTLGQHGPQLQQFKGEVAQAQAAVSKLTTRLSCGG